MVTCTGLKVIPKHNTLITEQAIAHSAQKLGKTEREKNPSRLFGDT